MKIKLTTPLAGISFAYRPGEIIDVSDDEGRRHIEHGNGVEVRSAPPTVSETADALPIAEETRAAEPEIESPTRSRKSK
ncbi:MAG: hypothetical protein JO353_13555 [Phycisphaerae bacterium]|nr:hypothetical protein [Phycisphaerae bacterium]